MTKPLPKNVSYTTYTSIHNDTYNRATNAEKLPIGKTLNLSRRCGTAYSDAASVTVQNNQLVTNNSVDFMDRLASNSFTDLVSIESGIVNDGYYDRCPQSVKKLENGRNHYTFSKDDSLYKGKQMGETQTKQGAFTYTSNANDDNEKNVVIIIGDPDSDEAKGIKAAFDKNRNTANDHIIIVKPDEMNGDKIKKFLQDKAAKDSNIAIVNTTDVEALPLEGSTNKTNNTNLYLVKNGREVNRASEQDYRSLLDLASTTASEGHVSAIQPTCHGTALLEDE